MNRRIALDAAGDYRTKATLGITGSFRLRVHIDGGVRHLDVGSSYPGAGEGPKGLAVRQLKRHVSWVQTVEKIIIDYRLYSLNPSDIKDKIETQPITAVMKGNFHVRHQLISVKPHVGNTEGNFVMQIIECP